MKKHLLLLLLSALICLRAEASLELGVGLNSSFSGRMIPTAALALTGSASALSAHSSGVQNSYSYHSVYGLNFYYTRDVGSLSGGNVNFGFGLGTLYAKRGFQDLDSSVKETDDDYAAGPAIRVNYSFANFIYINLEAMYGLRGLFQHLTMSFQDHVVTSVGIRIW